MSNYTNNLFVPNSENNSWSNLFGLVPEKSKVLDVGCSSGNFGEVLIKEKQCSVVGLDLDKADVELAKKKLDKALVLNIEKDSISNLGKFDIIIFADVLEHLQDPVSTLEKVKKSLTPKGRILFSIPNMGHISVRLNLLVGKFNYADTGLLDRTHFHYYDEHEVMRIFKDAGLAVDVMNPTVYEFPASVLESSLSQVGLSGSDKFYDVLKDTYAQVFQFVGSAVVSNSKNAKSKSVKYINPHDELRDIILERDAEISAKETHIKNIEAELETIKNSKKWIYANKVAALKPKVSRKKKK